MWRFIIQSIRAGYEYTDRVHSLAKLFGLFEHEYVGVSLHHARTQLTIARRIQKQVFKDESEKHQNWLEELANEMAMYNPGSSAETMLQQMILRSRATARHHKQHVYPIPI